MSITWAEKIKWLGMTWESVESHGLAFRVRVNRNPGLVSFGDGETLEKALESAAIGQGIDWWSVTRKMTEKAWHELSHL